MNLNFVDNNNSFSGLIQSTSSDGQKGGLPDLGNETPFADRLTAMLSSKTCGIDKAAAGNGLEQLAQTLETGNGKVSALEFLDKFKHYLKMAGVVLENATIDKKGVAALEELLVRSGFSRKEINTLVADLEEEGSPSLELSEFLEGLESLNIKNEDDDEILFAISDLPFIKSILTALGIPEDMSKSLIADAKQDGGINLDILISGLKELQKQSFFAGTAYTQNSQTDGLDKMLQALGLERQGSEKTPLTLGDFVTALEQMRISDKSKSTDTFKLMGSGDIGKGEKGSEELINSLMNGISRSQESSMKYGDSVAQKEIDLDGNNRDNLIKLFGLKIDHNSGAQLAPFDQGELDPELARLLSNVDAVAKEIKNGSEGLKVLGKEGKDGAIAKESLGTIATLEASGGAGGEFREMGMETRAQAAAKAAVSRANLPSHVTNQVGKGLMRAVSQGETELKLQLNPPELGRIIVTIDKLGNSLKVSVVTESLAAKEILAASANDLKATLSNSGISINSFDVEMGSDFKQSMADARQHSSGSNSKRGKGRGSKTGEINGGGDSTINIRGFADDAGALHFVA